MPPSITDPRAQIRELSPPGLGPEAVLCILPGSRSELHSQGSLHWREGSPWPTPQSQPASDHRSRSALGNSDPVILRLIKAKAVVDSELAQLFSPKVLVTSVFPTNPPCPYELVQNSSFCGHLTQPFWGLLLVRKSRPHQTTARILLRTASIPSTFSKRHTGRDMTLSAGGACVSE